MDIIETVRTQAGVADEAQAQLAAAAVLEAFGGRIAGVDALAVELPTPLASALRRGSDGEAHQGGTMELVAKTEQLLAEQEDAPKVEALDLVVAVLRGIATSVDRVVVDKISGQLPADLTQLLIAEEEDDTPVREAAGG